MKKRPLRKQLFAVLVTLVSISFLSFFLMALTPGDPAEIMLRASGVIPTEASVIALRAQLGLDLPLLTRYFRWLGGVLTGDLGVSFSTGLPVAATLLPALGRTVQLTAYSFLFTLLISLPTGLLCARHRGGMLDGAVRVLTDLFGSAPSFVLGAAALYFFSVRLKWFPAIANQRAFGLVLPVAVLSLSTSAWMIRQVRAAALESRAGGYVLALRARGVSAWRIEAHYVLKSAMLPILASLGTCLGSMLAGGVLVENIFSWSGLGKLAISAVNARDFPLLQGFILWVAVLYYLLNFCCDGLYAHFEPRMHREGTL